jgi:hypothetical protein
MVSTLQCSAHHPQVPLHRRDADLDADTAHGVTDLPRAAEGVRVSELGQWC